MQGASVLHEEMLAMDPTIQMGYEVFFNKEIFVNFFKNNDEEGTREIVRFRIFTKTSPEEEVRIEMTMDSEICLFLECQVNREIFQEIQNQNGLRVEFSGFANSIKDMLERSVKPAEGQLKEQCLIQFRQNQESGGELTFLQKLKLRMVKVFTLQFVNSSDDFIQAQVQYRFNKLKTECDSKDIEINEILRHIKSKNPSFAKQLENEVRLILQKKMDNF